MLKASVNGYSSVCKCLEFLPGLRGVGRRGVGRLAGVAWAMVLAGMRDASKRNYKWGFLQTGHSLKPRERRKSRQGGQV